MKNITVTVLYPVTFTMDIDDTKSVEEVKEEILDMSDKYLIIGPCKPVITDCTDDIYKE